MKVVVKKIAGAGDLPTERVVCIVTEKCNIGRYVFIKSKKEGDENINGDIIKSFWIPDRICNAGDAVVIYTKSGEEKHRSNINGSVTHFYYLNNPETLWSGEDDAAAILEISGWDFKTRSVDPSPI